MANKPWAIIILSVLHILEPIFKVLIFSVLFSLAPWDLVRFVWHSSSAFPLFEMFCLFPIAGVAIFLIKRWSLGIFLLIELWVLIANIGPLKSFFLNEQYLIFGSIILFSILNIIVVVYFMVPAVNSLYFDPRMRWWESSLRYTVSVPCNILLNETETEGYLTDIINISDTGLFITQIDGIKIIGPIIIQFNMFGDLFRITGEVVHNANIGGIQGMGVRYIDMSKIQTMQMKYLTNDLENKDYPRRPNQNTLTRRVFKLFTFKRRTELV